METNVSEEVAKLSVENPIEPVKVKEALGTMVAANVFGGKSGTLASSKEVRLVEHNVTFYELI